MRQNMTWLALKLSWGYRKLARLMGDGIDVRNNTMAEDILECDYTLAAKRVMVTMRKLMEGDEGGIGESLQVALTW